MFYPDYDEDVKRELGIELYSQNDNFFRSGIKLEEYAALPRLKFDSFFGEDTYKYYIRQYPPVVFIDLGDITRFLRTTSEPGFDAIDINAIAELICEFIGLPDSIYEVLWTTFDEDITSVIQARLGVDELDSQMTIPFNNAMAAIGDIATLIQNYLINSRYPIIEHKSIYTVGVEKSGLLALRLRTYKELADEF